MLSTLQPGGMATDPTRAAGGPGGGDKARRECEHLLRASGMARKRIAFGMTKLFIDGQVDEELQLVRVRAS